MKKYRNATADEVAIIKNWLPEAVSVNPDGTAEWFSNHLKIDNPTQKGDVSISWWRTNLKTGAVRFMITRNDPKHDMDMLDVTYDPKHGLVWENVA